MVAECRFFMTEMIIARAMMSNIPISTPTTMITVREIPGVAGLAVASVGRGRGETA